MKVGDDPKNWESRNNLECERGCHFQRDFFVNEILDSLIRLEFSLFAVARSLVIQNINSETRSLFSGYELW